MRIVYLDQNRWIDLARAAERPGEHPDTHRILLGLLEQVERGQLALPLSATTIYETFKANDSARRTKLARTQATLSRGIVLRGRHSRLRVEIAKWLRACHGLPPLALEPRWFLSNVFFESFAEADDHRLGDLAYGPALDALALRSAENLFRFLAADDPRGRAIAVAAFSDGSERLRATIEKRRLLWVGESMSMRRRAYGAQMFIDEQDLILRVAVENGVVPYVHAMVVENQFSSLAIQAGLNKRYNVGIFTKLSEAFD